VTITNNLFARNVITGPSGGVIAMLSSPGRVVNNTIADNTGGGIYMNDAVGAAIVNNIIANNSGNGVERTDTAGYYLDYNDLYPYATAYFGVTPGPNDLSVDPAFIGTGVDVSRLYRLQSGSPVRNTGSTVWAPFRDIDGAWRFSGGSVSMGAFEAPGSVELNVFLPLALRN
jgi:parallel beta-helix repeat protein